ncbi:MAG TPA: GDCCVxC domain-containing (seleno)protein [Chloroflexota bacterium]|nr:GDCCVxC domain-containing (seleno)protein [Chloroflexota bacterium]
MDPTVITTSILTCPVCGVQHAEEMADDACQFFYRCTSCDETLRPHPGDCCVFCSYGSAPCPPVQQGERC